jgi:hypothetical protein
MSYKVLFDIILKIFGLFLLKDGLLFCPQILASIFFINNAGDISTGVLDILLNLVLLFFYLLLAWVAIFKTDVLLKAFKLNDETKTITFLANTNKEVLLRLAIIIISGIIFIDHIPKFINQFITYYQNKNYLVSNQDNMISPMITSLSKIMIAVILIRYQTEFVNFIATTKENTTEHQ